MRLYGRGLTHKKSPFPSHPRDINQNRPFNQSTSILPFMEGDKWENMYYMENIFAKSKSFLLNSLLLNILLVERKIV